MSDRLLNRASIRFSGYKMLPINSGNVQTDMNENRPDNYGAGGMRGGYTDCKAEKKMTMIESLKLGNVLFSSSDLAVLKPKHCLT